jgi:hypothetical protein
MSGTHVYLSLVPQALVASMLSPAEFGRYYAVGKKAHVNGDAIFFELDPAFRSDDFPFEIIPEQCVANAAGEPKASLYLSIYRVLSRIPVSALGSLYLVTGDGQTLEIPRHSAVGAESLTRQADSAALHLYQELCPISPMVASRLDPPSFCRFITDPGQPIHVPRIVFSELMLHDLASDPVSGTSDDLPYQDIEHLRDCLQEIASTGKETKLVLKHVSEGVLYRMIEGGFYVGDQTDFACYRLPSVTELESGHRRWWRSAQHLPSRRF